MSDMYEKFRTFEKNLESENRARPNRKVDRALDKLSPWEIGTSIQTDSYREGWDRIFGDETRNALSDESKK